MTTVNLNVSKGDLFYLWASWSGKSSLIKTLQCTAASERRNRYWQVLIFGNKNQGDPLPAKKDRYWFSRIFQLLIDQIQSMIILNLY